MIYLLFIPMIFFQACAAFPQIADDIEKIETEDSITIKCTKDCFQKDTDVNVVVQVKNKDAGPVAPTQPASR